MKVIVAIDDSPRAEGVLEHVDRRKWPPNCEFRVLSVVEPASVEELAQRKWADVVSEVMDRRKRRAHDICEEARAHLQAAIPDALVHYEVRHGSPREQIVEAAIEWGADKVIVGAHSKAESDYLLGTVSRTVAAHAPCSVEIVRPRKKTAKIAARERSAAGESTHRR